MFILHAKRQQNDDLRGNEQSSNEVFYSWHVNIFSLKLLWEAHCKKRIREYCQTIYIIYTLYECNDKYFFFIGKDNTIHLLLFTAWQLSTHRMLIFQIKHYIHLKTTQFYFKG